MQSRVIDVSNPDSFANVFPHAFFRELRAVEPVYWHKGDVHGGPGYWIVSKYDDLCWVSKNPGLFASGLGNQIEDPLPGQLEVVAGKGCGGKEQREAVLGPGDLLHHPVDDAVHPGDEGFLDQVVVRVIEDPLASVAVGV